MLRKGERVDSLFPRKSFSSYLKTRPGSSSSKDYIITRGAYMFSRRMSRLGCFREETRVKPSWDFRNQEWSKNNLRGMTLGIRPM